MGSTEARRAAKKAERRRRAAAQGQGRARRKGVGPRCRPARRLHQAPVPGLHHHAHHEVRDSLHPIAGLCAPLFSSPGPCHRCTLHSYAARPLHIHCSPSLSCENDPEYFGNSLRWQLYVPSFRLVKLDTKIGSRRPIPHVYKIQHQK